MAKHILGIYWDNISMRACLLRVGISEFIMEKIVVLERYQGDPSAPGKDIAHEIGTLRQSMDTPFDTCVSCLSEHEIMYRSLLRPFGDRKKIASTIGSEVETLLPVLEDSVVMDHVVLGRDDAGLYRVETASAQKGSVENLIRELKSGDMDPEIVDSPSIALAAGARNIFDLKNDRRYLFLYMGWQDTSMAVLEGKDLRYVGALPYGFEKIASCLESNVPCSLKDIPGALNKGIAASEALDAYIREVLISLHRIGSGVGGTVLVPLGYAYYIKDLAARFHEADDIPTEIPALKEIRFDGGIDEILLNFLPVSLACRGFDNTDAVNFRQGDLSFTKRMEWIKGYAGTWAKVALALVVLWFFATGLDVYLKGRIDSDLSERIRKEFSASMPQGTPMVDAVKQMEQYLGRLSGQAGGLAAGDKDTPLEIIRDLSAGISRGIDVMFDNITIDETTITLSGSTKTYDDVEKIKASLSALSFVSDVKIITANVDKTNQRVNIKLVCKK